MNIRSILLPVLLTLALVTSCDEGNKATPTLDPEGARKSILFATTITNPEGNSGSVYLQAISDLSPASYDNGNSIPVGFGAPPIAFANGHVYTFPDYMGNSKAELGLYGINADNQLQLKGSMPLPAGAAACNIVELNDTKAYVSCQNLGLVIAFNPSTMQEIKRIDLTALSHADTRVAPAAMIIRGKELFVGLSQFNSQWMPSEKSIEIALIDTEKDEYVKTLRNTSLGVSVPTRPIDRQSIFMDEKGDIYINCIASFGFMKDFPGGIVRIKKGETEVDPTFCIRLDKTKIEGLSTEYAEFIGTMFYGGNGKLYAYANSNKLDPEGDKNPYTILSHCPVIIDLYAGSIKKIEGLPVSNPHGVAIGMHKGLVVFGSANREHNGFYTFNPATQEVAGPVVKVQGWPSFFHSFTQQ